MTKNKNRKLEKINILYQSLEYPNRFVKDLASALSENIPNSQNIIASKGITEDPKLYHTNICRLIKTWETHLLSKPDIIVLGEYTAPDTLELENYEIQGKVSLSEGKSRSDRRGTRGMTILVRKEFTSWDRIAIYDHSNFNDVWRTPELKNEREGTINYYSERRANRIAEQKGYIEHIGQFIEVMYKNRYIQLAHVKGIATKAQQRAGHVINNPIYNEEDCFLMLCGDTNAQVKSDQHKVDKRLSPVPYHKFIANTNADSITNQSNPYGMIQSCNNIKGKTATANVIHDGAYTTQKKGTIAKIIGSVWALISNSKDNSEWTLLSDHKGIMMELNVDSNIPTLALTPLQLRKAITLKNNKIVVN